MLNIASLQTPPHSPTPSPSPASSAALSLCPHLQPSLENSASTVSSRTSKGHYWWGHWLCDWFWSYCQNFLWGRHSGVLWRSSVKNSRQEPTLSNGSAPQSMAALPAQRVLGMRTRSFNKIWFDWLIDWLIDSPLWYSRPMYCIVLSCSSCRSKIQMTKTKSYMPVSIFWSRKIFRAPCY